MRFCTGRRFGYSQTGARVASNKVNGSGHPSLFALFFKVIYKYISVKYSQLLIEGKALASQDKWADKSLKDIYLEAGPHK